ncbi:hypothetical protein [Alteromonas lipolytica]|uniref:Uncharacterized protein n=1 Tax=Alteromonas lipolytica TaxID=1856405 RepID=A0A1E8FGB2_9ALTE|nr:hypothetical protein [Alteromonas lipolytica]OFI34997.1 hypothetical protein BFC17_15665 [Alteromonas lipolytica]GGF55724.1 hypothetical protein GCM10011338_05020 [Alteromonas lipolytica]
MSRFSQIMQRGQKKVNYRPRQAQLLMTLSDDQHKAIARLIQLWLSDSKPAQNGPSGAVKSTARRK